MKFPEKHPYLFWELIGFGVIFVDFIFLVFMALLDLKGDTVYLTIVMTAIIGSSIIFLSPAVIFLKRREYKRSGFDNRIEMIMIQKKSGAFLAVFVIIAMFLVFLIVVGFSCYTGFVIFAPLGIYPSAIIYFSYKKYIRYKFYKVKNTRKYYQFITVDDSNFLDTLDKNYTIALYDTSYQPSDEVLDFLYNALNFRGLIKYNKLLVYTICNDRLSEKYNLKTTENLNLFCVLPETLNISDKKELDEVFRKHILPNYDDSINFLLEEYSAYMIYKTDEFDSY